MSMRSFSGWACQSGVHRAIDLAAHLVARILVDASPVAVVVAAILEVIAVLSGHGQSAPGQLSAFLQFGGPGGAAHDARRSLRGQCAGANAGREVARSGEEQEQGTHPFDAIVTIGTMLSSKQASWAGSVD